MTNKVAIFDGRKLYVWFEQGELLGDAYENNIVALFDHPNIPQQENIDKYDVYPNIEVKMNADMSGKFGEPFIQVKGQSSVLERSKNISMSINMQIKPKEKAEITANGILLFLTKHGVKKVPMKFSKNNPPEMVILSTLSNKDHGWIAKLSKIYHPLNAIKRLLQRNAKMARNRNDVDTSVRYLNHEMIHVFWFENDGVFQHRQVRASDHELDLTLKEAA